MITLTTPHTKNLDPSRALSLLPAIHADPMAGWFTVPSTPAELRQIKTAATQIQKDSTYLVCIGIGGSYLGHRAVIEALKPTLPRTAPTILYAGNSLSPSALHQIIAQLENADFSINVISKSGTTTEPAIAFRILKQKLIEKYGATAAAQRIYATTDQSKGALHDEAVQNGYHRFIVPDNIGGRYSVLTPVGLLPLAAAGVDIDALLTGARTEFDNAVPDSILKSSKSPTTKLRPSVTPSSNSAIFTYATLRHLLYQQGHDVEVLASFEPALAYFHEWWKQLFGESEGKQNQGIFPASTVYTTDLHSLGQYLQEGRRNIFETILRIEHSPADLTIPDSPDNSDGLNYLAGQTLSHVNNQALNATITAHRAGGIPVLELSIPDLTPHSLGRLIYFFELSCALSAKLSGVDPFNQPGVEAYKTEMFHLLGKPGY